MSETKHNFPGGKSFFFPWVDHETPVNAENLNWIGFEFYQVEYNIGINAQAGFGSLKGRFENNESKISSAESNINKVGMIGSGNACWIPCIYEVAWKNAEAFTTVPFISNEGAQDNYYQFRLPLPTNKGGKKLYVSRIGIGLYDADVNNYITRIQLQKLVWNGFINIIYNEQDFSTPQAIDIDINDNDCSTHDTVVVNIYAILTHRAAFEIAYVNLKCYYD